MHGVDKLYTVSQVAKLYGISTHTLRHYDKTGILEPEVRDEDNGYRYYSFKQFGKLEIIIHLRSLNFSIEIIKKHLEELDYEFTLKLIGEKIEENNKELEELKKVKNHLEKEKIYFNELIAAQSNINIPFIEEVSEKKGIYALIKSKRREDLFLGFKELDDILGRGWRSENSFGILIDKKDIYQYGANPCKLTVLKEIDGVGESYTLKGGTYISMYTFKNPEADKPGNEKNYDLFFEWIERSGYEIDGDLFLKLLAGPGRAKNTENFIDKLMIPVKKIR